MYGHLPRVLYPSPAVGALGEVRRASSRHVVVGTQNDSNAVVTRPSTPLILLSEASRNGTPACWPVFPISQDVPAEQVTHGDAKYQV